MDEIMDQLNQVIEERVLELKRKRFPLIAQRPRNMSSAWIEFSIAFQRMTGNGWMTSLWLKWIYRNRSV